MTQSQAKTKIRVADLAYYFDGQECDRTQTGEYARRLGDILALRQRLLGLPGPQFDATLKTLANLVREPKASSDTTAKKRASPAEAEELLEIGLGAGGSGGGRGGTPSVGGI